MIFKKPNIRYVDMAIYIDEHVYEPDCDENLIFEYIYHLVNMLAHKSAYFNKQNYYEDFSLRAATEIFFRLKNKKQFELNELGEPKLGKVKSVLNYIKKTLYAMKVDFEQENYCQTAVAPPSEDTDISLDFKNQLLETVDAMRLSEFNLTLGDIIKTARAYLLQIPYSSQPAMWNNIYLSCLLSFLNSITFSNKTKQKLQKLDNTLTRRPEILDKLYDKEKENSTILYHLDSSMYDYITVLTTKLKHVIAKDLASSLDMPLPANISAQNLLISSVKDDYEDNY